MGNDGGSIPSRRELVKESKRGPSTSELFQSKQLNHQYLWTRCAVSDELLGDEPIVSDYKGRLYNKSAILQTLIQRANLKKQDKEQNGTVDEKSNGSDGKKEVAKDPIAHIKSMKDVVELHFSTKPSESKDKSVAVNDKTNSSATSDDSYDIQGPESWICPASQEPVLETSKGPKFIYIVPCGHVFAESAYKELKFTQCFVCDTPVDALNGVVTLNPTSEPDVESSEERYRRLTEAGLTHSLTPVKKAGKKSKKDKKRKLEHEESANETTKKNKKPKN